MVMLGAAQNPVIDLDRVADLTAEEREIARLIVGREGRLRASKPTIDYRVVQGQYTRVREATNPVQGRAAYVWRMVAFQISVNPKHHCMPCTADFDIPVADYAERRAESKRLDGLVDRIVNSVPKREWHGISRWHGAFYGR